jgi:C1A family cysteine protease
VFKKLEQGVKMIARKIRRYGWNPQHPDARDWPYEAPRGLVLPSKYCLRAWGPWIYDQGQLGSCTGNGIARAIQFDQIKQWGPNLCWQPSRLQIYYNERVIEGTVSQDAGAMIRDGIKSVNTDGVAPEWMWPYDISKFAVKPPQNVINAALLHPTVMYQAMPQDLITMKSAILAHNHIVIGFTVYDSFESQAVTNTGNVPMPDLKNEQVLGGHCVTLMGWDDATQRFDFANSWGQSWGAAGYGTFPYAYMLNPDLASDFWVIQSTKMPRGYVRAA